MAMTKRFALIFCLAVLFLAPVRAQQAAADPYAAAVARIMELTNVRQTTAASLEAMYVNMKAQLGITEAQAGELAGVVTAAMYDSMVEMYVPIYRKYYTLDDLAQLCAFYETPLGKKAAAVTPRIVQEGMQNMSVLEAKAATAVQRFFEKIR